MKAIKLEKNGKFVGEFTFNENAGETLKRFCIRVANVNINANYELKVSGDITRTFKN